MSQRSVLSSSSRYPLKCPPLEKENVVLKEFKDFINKGNLVDLAIAFVLGGAFAALVTSFINNVVMGIIAQIAGKPNFDSVLQFGTAKKNDAGVLEKPIRIGSFVTTLINFLILAFVVFLLVKAYNKAKKSSAAEAGPSSTDQLLMEIRDSLRR
jgi:large conductance mechanosensitive channel